MKDNIPPEEKLLRLIRNNKPPAPLAQMKNPFPVSEPDSPRTPQHPRKPSITEIPKRAYLSRIHLVANGFLGLSTVVLLGVLLYPRLGFQKLQAQRIQPPDLNQRPLDPASADKALAAYSQTVQVKRIFNSPALQESPASPSAVPNDAIKDINLVGIISGDDPQAVIEDKKTQKTYYLTKGQSIGEISLEDIREGKIILNYKGQHFELHL